MKKLNLHTEARPVAPQRRVAKPSYIASVYVEEWDADESAFCGPMNEAQIERVPCATHEDIAKVAKKYSSKWQFSGNGCTFNSLGEQRGNRILEYTLAVSTSSGRPESEELIEALAVSLGAYRNLSENWIFQDAKQEDAPVKKLKEKHDPFAPEGSIVTRAIQTLEKVPEAKEMLDAYQAKDKATFSKLASELKKADWLPPEAQDAVGALLYKSDVEDTANRMAGRAPKSMKNESVKMKTLNTNKLSENGEPTADVAATPSMLKIYVNKKLSKENSPEGIGKLLRSLGGLSSKYALKVELIPLQGGALKYTCPDGVIEVFRGDGKPWTRETANEVIRRTADALKNSNESKEEPIKESIGGLVISACVHTISAEIPKMIAKFNDPIRTALQTRWDKDIAPVFASIEAFASADESQRKAAINDVRDFVNHYGGHDKDNLLQTIKAISGSISLGDSSKAEKPAEKENEKKESVIKENIFEPETGVERPAMTTDGIDDVAESAPDGQDDAVQAAYSIYNSAKDIPPVKDSMSMFAGIALRLLQYGAANEAGQRAQVGGQGERLSQLYTELMANDTFQQELSDEAGKIMSYLGITPVAPAAPMAEKVKGDVWLTKTESTLSFGHQNAVKVIKESVEKFVSALEAKGSKEDGADLKVLVQKIEESKDDAEIKKTSAQLVDSMTELSHQYCIRISERTQSAFDVMFSKGLVDSKEAQKLSITESVVEWDGTVRKLSESEQEWRSILED